MKNEHEHDMDMMNVCSETERLIEIQNDIAYLKDLFARRLFDDKQKSLMIQELKNEASFACVEPFLHDLILLIDRMERTDDETAQSVMEELKDILERRNVYQIQPGHKFNPAFHKAVRVVTNSSINELRIQKVLRNGYVFSGRVLRPAEVCVEKPEVNESCNDA